MSNDEVVLVAVISDIHGNSGALDAVIADARDAGVEAWWLLGDLVAMGPDPVGVVARLRELDPAVMVRGNTDRYVLTGEGPFAPVDRRPVNPDVVKSMLEIAASMAWTKGMLTASGSLDWLAVSVAHHRQVLPSGERLVAVHATVTRDDGVGIAPNRTDAELETLFAGVHADLVIGGHTHDETDLVANRTRYVNPGSVSNQHDRDKRARYLLLHSDHRGVTLQHRRVTYDVGATIRAIRRCGIPGGALLLDRYFT
jgi:putative phosphoesterase